MWEVLVIKRKAVISYLILGYFAPQYGQHPVYFGEAGEKARLQALFVHFFIASPDLFLPFQDHARGPAFAVHT